ncbi:MAG: hypothetical protein WCA07_06010, partial [Gloeobacterales cyanobacterium]
VTAEEVIDNVTAIGGSVTVLGNGQVTKDAVAIGGDVILKPNARVNGDAVAVGGTVVKEKGAILGGETVTVQDGTGLVSLFRQWGWFGFLFGIYLANVVFHFFLVITVTALGAVLLTLLPDFLRIITATIQQSPLKSGAWGLGGTVAFGLLTTLISGSLLGNLLGPVVVLAMFVAGILGAVSMGVLIGEKTLSGQGRTPMQQFLFGMLILALVGLIPFVGGTVFWLVSLFGFGGVLAWKFEPMRLKLLGQRTPRPEITKGTSDHPQEGAV